MKNLDEEDGIKAIQFLQGIANREETEIQARAGWNGMSQSEKESTIEVYEMLKSKVANKHIHKAKFKRN